MTLEYRCSNCGTLLQTTNGDALDKTLDEALSIIHDLLGLELGSSDRALEFLYQHMPQSPADRKDRA